MEKKIRGIPRINELIGNGARIIFSTDRINNNIKNEFYTIHKDCLLNNIKNFK